MDTLRYYAGFRYTDPKEPEYKVNPNTIYLVDADIDGNESIFKKIITSSKDAFSRPSIVCKLIDSVPDNEEINIVINTRGGALVNCEKILKKLLHHTAGYKVYIRNECYSAGAIIALG